MNIKKVMVAGSGVLGSQIAFQTAFKGFEVSVYDISDEILEKSKERFETLKTNYINDLQATQEEVDAAYSKISFYSSMEEAVKDVDLMIEAVPEVIDIKKTFYENLAKLAPEKTIFASNSSTMIPSQIVGFTGRADRFLHLHFANLIWLNNTAEIMKHEATDTNVFEEVIDFAKAIGMVALPIYKEQPGYILNSLLIPLLDAAQNLVVNGVADPETVDKTWMTGMNVSVGPFGMLDVIGLNTPYNIAVERAKLGDKQKAKVAEYFEKEFISKGHFGVQSGKGFYDYPNPAYKNPDFLK